MRSKRILSALLFTAVAFAGLLLMFSLPEAQAQDGDVITLNYNLQTEPPTLDPAKATDSASFFVIEQLFIGLVDVDDETGEVVPELAENWDVSADGTVYTHWGKSRTQAFVSGATARVARLI